LSPPVASAGGRSRRSSTSSITSDASSLFPIFESPVLNSFSLQVGWKNLTSFYIYHDHLHLTFHSIVVIHIKLNKKPSKHNLLYKYVWNKFTAPTQLVDTQCYRLCASSGHMVLAWKLVQTLHSRCHWLTWHVVKGLQQLLLPLWQLCC
jgi:hypothetical protein